MNFWGVSVWAAALLFARIGSLVMLLPGFGEAATPARFRLAFALLLSALLAGPLANTLPPAPATIAVGLGMLMVEMLIGLIIGGAARVLMSGLETAGQIIGLETGLSYAQTVDPTQGQTGQVFSVFLNLFGVTLLFATDLHLNFLRGVAGSYQVFTPGQAPAFGDAAALMLRAAGDAFRIGLQIAAPLVIAGIVFRMGLGVLSRLVPQIQVFFVALPLNVLGGLMLMAISIGAGMLVWLDRLAVYANGLR
jgi:flagellar biosynthesis protein FliR